MPPPVDDDVDVQLDELGRKARHLVNFSIRITIFYDNILPFDVAQLTQSSLERFDACVFILAREVRQITDP